MAGQSSSKIPSAGAAKPQSGQRAKSDPSESKFELIAELGRGGMATVYLARAKKRPDKLLVLKQLRSELAENPEFLAMFLEEARLAGKLQHPNIVETYEVGQDAGTYYIAMEYLEGLSLQAVLTKFGWKGEFTFPMQTFVLIEALKALEQAYSQRDDDGTPLKIVHRDVSPPNIIITFDGQVKLVDFGIAKAANSHVETRTGLIKGKLTYMAPEQAQSGDVDSRTDIYSVGVMLWQAASGSRRWKGIENTEVLKRLHSGDVVESPNARKNLLPAIVDDIVMKAIAADPEKRHRSAGAFRGTLESLLREMNAEVTSKDLAALMTKHFGDARKRAADVMKERLAELDQPRGGPQVETKESVTAIRAANDRRSPTQHGGQTMVDTDTSKSGVRAAAKDAPQVGGAAAGLAKKIQRPPTSPKADSTRTESSEIRAAAPMRSNRAPLIAAIGLAIVAALGLIAFRAHRAERAAVVEAAPTPQAQATTPAAVSTAVPPTLAEPAEDTSAPSQEAASGVSQSDHHRHHHARTPAAPTQVDAPPTATHMAGATPAPMPVAVTAANVPSSASSPDASSHAPLDKVDPWSASQSTAAPVDRSDPWGRRGTPSNP